MSPDDIKSRITEASETLRALPRDHLFPSLSVTSWPDVVQSYAEAYGHTDEVYKLPVPSARDITRMDEAIRWVHLLSKWDRVIVWGIAAGIPVTVLARKMRRLTPRGEPNRWYVLKREEKALKLLSKSLKT